MSKKQNPAGGNQIVTLLIVAGGAYLAYTYLQSSGLWAQWFGGGAGATSGGMPTVSTIAAGLQNGQFVGAGTDASGNAIVHQVSTGAYYAVNPTTGVVSAASGPGTTSSPTTTTVPTTVLVTTPVTTPVNSNLQNQLQAMANQFMQNTGAAGLNVDQWNFYYQQVTGNAVTPQQGEAIIVALGLSDATRGTIVSVSQYLTARGSAGLSSLGGIVSVPNSGPISNPLPTQSFNRGFGGYKNGVKANTYVN